MTVAAQVLDDRALNRALLARQHLLARSDLGVEAMVEHLVGLQAQTPDTPYVALWSRLEGFVPERLAELVRRRRVVRIVTMRSTIHSHTARDALRVRPLVDSAGRRALQSSRGRGLVGLDLDAVGAAAREVLEDEPLTFAELGRRLAPRWPDRDPEHLAMVARVVLPLVQVPPRGVWGESGPAVHTTLDSYVGRPVARRPRLTDLVRRYLAAFGPAGVRDAQTWSGLTVAELAPAFERLRPELVTFTDARGRELFDLPDAPRPPADVPAPVRLLGDFDEVWLGHADRDRVVAPEHRQALMRSVGSLGGAVLLDGRVQGLWRLRRARGAATLALEPFGRLRREQRDEVAAEGPRLVDALLPDLAGRLDVVVER